MISLGYLSVCMALAMLAGREQRTHNRIARLRLYGVLLVAACTGGLLMVILHASRALDVRYTSVLALLFMGVASTGLAAILKMFRRFRPSLAPEPAEVAEAA